MITKFRSFNMAQIDLIKQASSLVAMLTPRKTFSKQHTVKKKKPLLRISLDGVFQGKYLTRREAECVFYAMKKHTIKRTGEIMVLSPRTVEFYLKRIRKKLNCARKKDLVRAMHNTSFLKIFHPIKNKYDAIIQ